MLEPGSGRSDHGAILVTNAPRQYRDPKEPPTVPQIMVASEHYNRIARLLDGKRAGARSSSNVQNRFVDDTLDSFNIVAEIPGTDRADEVVMLGAHFDSWHAGTGATDNAAGSAAMMEAMRILKATGLRMRRTVRLALWTGEEQGLLGSRAYVKQHFADRDTMALKPEHAKLSAYFNMDNGTGAIRGVYLQGNEAVRPVFAAWMEPFRSLGMTTLSIRNTGVDRPRRRSTRSGCPASSSSRIRSSTARTRITRTWTSTTAAGRGPDEERGDHRVVRLSRGQPRRRCCRASRCPGPRTRPPATR